MSKVLICIDFINEIVGSSGKLAAKGYSAFCETHATLSNLAKRQAAMRADGGRVIHVHLGFAADYADHPPPGTLPPISRTVRPPRAPRRAASRSERAHARQGTRDPHRSSRPQPSLGRRIHEEAD